MSEPSSPRPFRDFAAAPRPIEPRQAQMFTRKAILEFPQKEPTADSLGEIEADDNHRYYIKGDAHGRRVRASEWLGSHISEAIGIGTPTPISVERIDGSIVFGSRRIAQVADNAKTTAYLTTPTVTNIGMPASGLSSVLSSIYALDMFINNEDRHPGNYLSVDDNGTRRLYAFDFSRAIFWQWPWNGFPASHQNTRVWGELLRNAHGFDQNSAAGTLDRLTGLAPATIESFINEMPPDWLPKETCQQFIGWWSSSAKNARIEALRAGLIDGTLL
jgi:hypothetical protein